MGWDHGPILIFHVENLGVPTWQIYVWHDSILTFYIENILYVLNTPSFNKLRPRQNGRHFPDDIFKCIFWNENIYISMNISLKFVPNVPINNISILVPIMAWRRPGNKPLSETMMVRLPTHICVSRPQWVNITSARLHYLHCKCTGDIAVTHWAIDMCNIEFIKETPPLAIRDEL